jgi:chemotaxis response regulator CheB
MVESEPQHLRVLIANEKRDRLLAQVVTGLGHDVIAREIYVKEVGAATERERPDVALIGLGLSSEHALELFTEIIREASCPVIALLSAEGPGIRARGREARCVRLHRGWRCRGAPERDRQS